MHFFYLEFLHIVYDYAGSWQSICMLKNGSHKQPVLQLKLNVVNYQMPCLDQLRQFQQVILLQLQISSFPPCEGGLIDNHISCENRTGILRICNLSMESFACSVLFRILWIALQEYWLVCSFRRRAYEIFCIVLKHQQISIYLEIYIPWYKSLSICIKCQQAEKHQLSKICWECCHNQWLF